MTTPTTAAGAAPTTDAARLERGSFRDPESRVFYAPEGVFRALSPSGLADWEAFEASGLAEAWAGDGRLVGSERVGRAELPAALAGDWAGVLRHEVVPTISYPYEWPFGMLKDAALLQLELLDAALERGLIIKDSSPYNVQWRGARPVFIDVGSFERLREGEPWIGYRQFCTLFLFPLMLRAYKDVPYQPWLRGSLDGIAPLELRNLMSLRDRFRRGVMTHVVLHARLEKRYADRRRDVKGELRRAGFRRELIVANVRKLRKLVARLDWTPPAGVWVEYGERNTYRDEEADRKAAFVRDCAAAGSWELAWDLGCNDGRFSRIAAEHARRVVAIDGDEGIVEVLYRALRDTGDERIVPLTMDLTDPSPNRGWRGRERRSLDDRGAPDLVLCLALVHHIAITGNVPLPEYLDWLRSLDAALVIEFPDREDPMVQRLLSTKREGLHEDYTRERFERALGERFAIERSETLAAGTRTLYFARPRA